jgi:integrase
MLTQKRTVRRRNTIHKSPGGLYERIVALGERAGVTRPTPHRLRDMFACDMAGARGFDLRRGENAGRYTLLTFSTVSEPARYPCQSQAEP